MYLIDVSGLHQPGWKLEAKGDGEIVDSDPAYSLDAYHGRYSYYVKAHANNADNDTVRLGIVERAPVDPDTGVLVFRFWAKSPPGETSFPPLRATIWPHDGNGNATTGVSGWAASIFNAQGYPVDFDGVTGPLTEWTPYAVVLPALPDDTKDVDIAITFGDDGAVLYDAMQLRHSAAGDEFISGETWERDVAVTTDSRIGRVTVPTGLPANVSASLTNYGPREGKADNDTLTEWSPRAEAFAAALLKQSAVLARQTRLDADPAPPELITPGSGLQLRVTGLEESLGDDWPVSTTYTEESGRFTLSVELGAPEPNLARETAAASSAYLRS